MKEDKPTLFHNEEQILETAAVVLEQFKDHSTPLLAAYKQLFDAYKKLLKQTKLLVKVSDRQQNQLTDKAEEVVRASEKKLVQFLDAIPVGVFVVDAQGHPYYANQKAQQLLGQGIISPTITKEDLAAAYQIYLADTTQLYPTERQPIIQAIEGHISSVDDMEIHRGEHIIPIEVWGTPIFNEKNKISYAIAAFQDITERKRAEKTLADLNKAYERFVPRQFLKLLNKKSVVDIQLGDQVEKEMSVLFSDIRGFTTLSEQMTPQENFKFINSYLGQMTPIIGQYHGFIDKYIGDAIMALFPDVDNAVKAAIEMLETLRHYNQGRRRACYQPIKIGIGLHAGHLMLGTVGGTNRMDGTVIADAVNLASRIESMTKVYGASLLISEEIYARLHNASQYAIRFIARVRVKGKSVPVSVYEVCDGELPETVALKMQTRHHFQQGIVHYHRQQFAEAKSYFNQVLYTHINDKAAQFYLEKCIQLQKSTVSDYREDLENR